MPNLSRAVAGFLVLLLAFVFPSAAHSDGILTHENIIDLTWESSILPLLKAKYPNLDEQIYIYAKAYAYGGALIQDGGYYLTEGHDMANVTHYVRSGDFVTALFRNVGDVNELAFAIGALAHYMGDIYGHREATNPSVYISYNSQNPPRIPKYPLSNLSPVSPSSITYEQDATEHTRVEFGFDVNALAHNRFLPTYFHQAVGLDVELRQFALAYYKTYGYADDFVRSRKDFRLSPYHYTAFHALPYAARELAGLPRWTNSDEGFSEAQKSLVDISNCVYEREFRTNLKRREPKSGHLGGLLKDIPSLNLVPVNRQTEDLYARALLLTISNFSQILQAGVQQAKSGSTAPFIPSYSGDAPADSAHPLANFNLDTGYVEKPGSYGMTDIAYLSLMHNLLEHKSVPIPQETVDAILAYFSDPNAPYVFSHEASAQQQSVKQMNADLVRLRSVGGSTSPLPYPTFAQSKPRLNSPKPLVQPIPATYRGCMPTTYAPLQNVLSGTKVP